MQPLASLLHLEDAGMGQFVGPCPQIGGRWEPPAPWAYAVLVPPGGMRPLATRRQLAAHKRLRGRARESPAPQPRRWMHGSVRKDAERPPPVSVLDVGGGWSPEDPLGTLLVALRLRRLARAVVLEDLRPRAAPHRPGMLGPELVPAGEALGHVDRRIAHVPRRPRRLVPGLPGMPVPLLRHRHYPSSWRARCRARSQRPPTGARPRTGPTPTPGRRSQSPGTAQATGGGHRSGTSPSSS